MSEGEGYEEKSKFAGERVDFLDITKTIAAFANCEGGLILLRGVSCDPKLLDSARLDDFVNKLVAPRIPNIVSVQRDKDVFSIEVPRSDDAPHVMAHSPSYKQANDKERAAFHQGQIYVRHSSKSEPATADDLREMIRKATSRALASLGDAIKRASVEVAEGGLPILAPGSVLEIAMKDVNASHPYTATTLGAKLGKGQQWTAAAAGKLEIKNDPKYWINIVGSMGHVIARKYSEEALKRLVQEIESDPDFDPYH